MKIAAKEHRFGALSLPSGKLRALSLSKGQRAQRKDLRNPLLLCLLGLFVAIR